VPNRTALQEWSGVCNERQRMSDATPHRPSQRSVTNLNQSNSTLTAQHVEKETL
jgi:hypothetical protein